MSYFLGAAIGTAISVAADHAIDNARRNRDIAQHNRAVALWHSPLSRLGRCGIYSLRAVKAVQETLTAIHTAAVPGWRYTNRVAIAGVRDTDRILIAGRQAAAVVDVTVDDDPVSAVRLVDGAVQLLKSHTGVRDLPVHAFVCRADAADGEPRDLPGPSGNYVAVTGLSWLVGLLRSRLGDTDGGFGLPDGLDQVMRTGLWSVDQLNDLHWATTRRFPDWWTIRDLRTDDGHGETMDLVCVGPQGVLAVEVSEVDAQGSADRVTRNAHRLRGYLPYADVIPVVVSESVQGMRFGPQVDTVGNPIAWISPQHFGEFAQQVRRRGVGGQDLAFLNAPAAGWYRKVGFGPDGPEVAWGWAS